MATVGRNDPCPCGSGKKHKHCCGGSAQAPSLVSRLMLGLVIVVILGAAYAGFTAMTADAGSAGPAPGKVWSPEHGHYH